MNAPATTTGHPRRWRRLLAWLAALVLLIVAAAGGATWYAHRWLIDWSERPQGPAETVQLTIAPGTPARAIARRLEDTGLIDDHRLLLAWLRLSQPRPMLQAGEYRITGPLSPRELVARLGRGSFERTVTVPEGWTASQIGRRLAEEDWITTTGAWMELVARPPADFFDGPTPPGAEGYLFPETYRFDVGSDARTIMRRMIATFHEVWNELEPNRRAEPAREMTMHEIVTLASLIQREARLAEEMPRIASVYYNRLRLGMRLQCDATVYYALGDDAWSRPLTYADLEVDHPYNTYRHAGLPPGPIANPGREAIAAALRPAETEDLYYVYIGEGRHAFSRTYRDHQAAVRRAREARRERGEE